MKITLLIAGLLTALSSAGPSTLDERATTKPPTILDPLFKKIALQAHNSARACHRVGNLTWSNPAAGTAQLVANNLAKTCQLQHSGKGYGENLYGTWSSSSTFVPDKIASTRAGIKSWYDEVSQYNFTKAQFSSGTGHFTQVVWNGTTSVGCAWAQTRCSTGWWYMVCEYSPAGNVIGQFDKNVYSSTCTTSPL